MYWTEQPQLEPSMHGEDFEDVDSLTALRGVLAVRTDDQGRSAAVRLRDERDADGDHEETLRDRYTDDADGGSEGPSPRFRTDGV